MSSGGLLCLRTWLCGPLLGVWADVGASLRDGEDQSFLAEDLDRPQDRVAAYVVLLLELLHGRQRAVSQSALRPAGHRPVRG
jgi:hypothetical protein